MPLKKFTAQKVVGDNIVMDVEIGDVKQESFFPRLKLKKWNNEVNFSVGLIDTPDGANVNKVGEKVEWEKGAIKARFYPLDDSIPEDVGEILHQPEDGGFEFDIEINEPMSVNFIDLSIQTKNLKFFYQPKLTKKEILNGDFRPKNVVGSYAVYHATRGNFHSSKENAEKYKTGKAFHIYRPKITDSSGKSCWGDLNLDEKKGILRVVIPESFLNEAVYPIIVDPTFGYTSTGGSVSSFPSGGSNSASVWKASIPEDGSVSKITVYGRNFSKGAVNQKGLIFDDSGGSPNNLQANSGSVSVNSTLKWRDFTLSASLVTGDYWLGLVTAGSNNDVRYDTNTGSGPQKNTSNGAYNFASPPSTITISTTNSDRNLSIYATYTASGGGTVVQDLISMGMIAFPR